MVASNLLVRLCLAGCTSVEPGAFRIAPLAWPLAAESTTSGSEIWPSASSRPTIFTPGLAAPTRITSGSRPASSTVSAADKIQAGARLRFQKAEPFALAPFHGSPFTPSGLQLPIHLLRLVHLGQH